MKRVRFILLYALTEFSLCWMLSVVFILTFESKVDGFGEAIFAGAGIQIIQVMMRFMALSYVIVWFVDKKMAIDRLKAIVISVLMTFHVALFTLVASFISGAEDVVFASVSVWVPIFVGVFLTPYVMKGFLRER